ncbi:MAG: four helix bundle protein [Cytophagales bacterium]|nr:four helix bundle protein [Cytophagales bacterium]
MNNYKDLIVWQKSIDLAVKIYESTKEFPKEEMYGLTSQVRRSAVSIASNIAEGAGRNSKKEFNNFLGISNGSSCELDTQLIIANKVNFLDTQALENIQSDILEIQKMNWALQKSLEITIDYLLRTMYYLLRTKYLRLWTHTS